ncbi:MAG: PQQ-binding-like beta-propeller repeat protein [Planctomycetota bacterium]
MSFLARLRNVIPLGCLAILVGCTLATPAISQTEPTSLWTRSQGDDWPRMLGVRYDSISNETGIRTDWGKAGLPIRWTQPTGTGYGNGVAALGRWFQFDRFAEFERLTCYRAETGETLWKWDSPVVYRDAYGYNNGPRASPVVDGDAVYVYGVSGTLACIAVADGRERWRRDMNRDYGVIPNFFGVGASPLVYGDLVLVMVGGSPASLSAGRTPTLNDLPRATPNGSAMVALDKKTGKEAYRVGNYLASYSAPIIAPLEGRDRCVALVREGLLVFDAATGADEIFYPFRSATFESVNAASPVAFGDNRIFISEAYEIGSAMVELRDGKIVPIWQDRGGRSGQAMRTHWATPVRRDNLLFASSGRNPPDTDLRCIEWSGNGPPRVRWSQRNRDRGTALAVDGHWLWLGEMGKLQLLRIDAADYQPIAEMDLGSMIDPENRRPYINPPSWAPPVLSHGLLYVRGEDRVICLELIPE